MKKKGSLSPSLSFSQTHTFSIQFQPTCNLGLNYIYPYSIYSHVKTPKCQKENRTPPTTYNTLQQLQLQASQQSVPDIWLSIQFNQRTLSRTLIPLSSCLLCCFYSRPHIPVHPVSKQEKKRSLFNSCRQPFTAGTL